MTPLHDLVVGIAAIVVGCLLIGGAIFDSRTLTTLAKVRLLAKSVGKAGARWIIAAIGAACIAMGALIASGWRVHW